MDRDSGEVNLASFEVNEEKNVKGDQPAQREDFHAEEVSARQYRQVGTNEHCPRCRALPLRGRRYSVAAQNIAYRLV